MKLIIFAIIFILSVFSNIFAQNSCPTIYVTGPSGITQISETMTFTAKVEGVELDKIKFEWTAVNGKIAEGQGTTIISIPYTQELAGASITATVKIIGLPENCPNTASSSGECSHCGYVRQSEIKLLDEFLAIPPRIHKERFEIIRLELSDDPTVSIYIVENIKKETSKSLVKQKISKTFDYLINTLELDKQRIFLQIVFGNENLTQFWYVLPGLPPPNENTEKIELNGKDYQQKLNEIFPNSKKKSTSKKS